MAATRTRRTAAVERAYVDRLPGALLQSVFLRLPPDARARAACVCRAWRDVASHPATWTQLNLTRAGGLTCTLNPKRILRRLAPRLTQLLELRLPAPPLRANDVAPPGCTPADALRAAVALLRSLARLRGPDALALRALHLVGALPLRRGDPAVAAECEAALRAVLAEAPRVAVRVDTLECDPALGVSLFAAPSRLRVRRVRWLCTPGPDGEADAPREEFIKALQRHASLNALTVDERGGALTPRLMSRLVNLALRRRLVALELAGLSLAFLARPMQQLARLLRDTASLRRLLLERDVRSAYSDEGVALCANALRENATLSHLELCCLGPAWSLVAPAVCDALAGHPTVTSLLLWEDLVAGFRVDLSALDAALARLLCANAPSLTRLEIHFRIVAPGQPPLALPLTFAALAGNTQLRALEVSGLSTSHAFVRRSVLPAVRANTALRQLTLCFHGELDAHVHRALAEAMRHLTPFVRERCE